MGILFFEHKYQVFNFVHDLVLYIASFVLYGKFKCFIIEFMENYIHERSPRSGIYRHN